jgi:hypothetical protein
MYRMSILTGPRQALGVDEEQRCSSASARCETLSAQLTLAVDQLYWEGTDDGQSEAIAHQSASPDTHGHRHFQKENDISQD